MPSDLFKLREGSDYRINILDHDDTHGAIAYGGYWMEKNRNFIEPIQPLPLAPSMLSYSKEMMDTILDSWKKIKPIMDGPMSIDHPKHPLKTFHGACAMKR